MASKDIFGNGNPEELFDSSLLDSTAEDTYGLNAGNKVDSAGTEPLTAEIERLSTDNINIAYTDNIGDDTDNIVSSPSLFNQTSSQEQQLQQATGFNKTDTDLDKNNIDSLTGNNKDNPLVGTPELKFLTDQSDDNSTSPAPQSIVPQAPGDITELKFIQDKSKLKVFEDGDLVEEVKAKQQEPVPFTIERIQIAALNSNDLPSVKDDLTYHDNGGGIGIVDGNDGNNRSIKNKIDGDEILQIKIQPTDNYNSAFSATVGVDQVGAIANKSDGGKVKIVAMRGATSVGEQIFNITNKKEQLTFTSDTAFDRLHLMAGDDNTKFTFRSTQFQAVVTPSPLVTYLGFTQDEQGVSLAENGSVVEQLDVGENQPVPNNSSRLEVTAVDSQDDGSVLDTTNYLSAEGIGIIDGDDNTEILQKRIDGDEILEFKINSTDNYNSALSATVALDKIKSVRANNGTLKDGGAVKILALRDDILVGGTSYNINSETEEIFFLSNQPFDRLQIQAGNDATQFTLRSVELESVTTSPSPTASLKFVQDRLRLNVFENEVISKQVRGGQNQAIPDAFERIEVRAVDSDDGGTVKIDSTFIDTGEGIGIADGQDGNSSLKKKIDGDEILEFKIKPTQSYETANQALINVDRVSAIDSKKNGGTVKVVAWREGNIVSEQTYTIANKNQKLSFTSDNAFDTLQLQAGDDNTKFSFRYIEFAVLTNVTPTDTEAPLISAALANDTAPNDTINNDGVTFDATIAGTVTDTSQVVEFVAGFNDTPITDYVNVLPQLNEDGSFTLNQATLEQIYGDVLPQGSHTLNLQAVDASGNQSDVFDIAFTLDNDTAAPTLSLLSTSDSGGSNTDNITNDTVPIITGNAEAGSVVQLFQNGEQEQDNQLIGETTADDTGNWQIATNSLADGTYNFSASATDIAGNTNNSATPLQLTVDTTQPTINFTTSIDTEPLAEGARLTGNLDGTGSDISSISYRFNNGAEITLPFDAAGAFDEELDLTGVSDGDYTLTVTITDTAGNVSQTTYNVTVGTDTSTAEVTAGLVNDTAPDNITNSDGITSDATIAGSIDNFGDSVRLRAGFGDTPTSDYVNITDSVNSGGNFNLDLSQLSNINRASLEDGAYSLNLLLEDLQGNQLSNSEVNFTLDTSNPVLELNTPVDGGEHSSFSRLIGNVSDTGSGLFDTSYSLDGQASSPLTVSNQGAFDQTLVPTGLTEGDHSLTLSVFDVAGNSTQTSANFTVSDDFIIGTTDTQGWGIKTADGVILGEQNSFVTQTAMEIDLGQDEGKRQLEFEIDAQFDTSDTNTASEDRLSLYLVDSFTPEVTLLDRGEPGTALFSLSGTDAEFTPGLVNYDGNRVRVDLTSLEGQTSGSLVFQLINNDSDNGSVVEIKDITNTVDPEAISGPVFPTDIERADIGEQINLGDFNTTTDVELLLSNVRLDSDTGTYTADLQVRNNGTTTLGRELAVVLTNLPDGVSLNSVSGTDSENSPYINLSNAIRPGGLNPQAISDAVQIVFDNPSLTRFDLQPVFYAGALEQPPQLSPIESQSVMPGERLEIPLIATDPNGDPISYSLRSDTPLPKGTLSGDGTLIFTPAPDDIGTYNFTVVATAGEVDVTQDVTITVEPDPITTTRVSGVIENTDQEALAGVVIELGGLQTTTDANGYFQLEVDGELPSDTLKVRAELLSGDDAYPFIAEKLPLVLEHDVYEGVNNIINRPIYLPVLDTASGVNVDPNADTTVTTDTIPGASVFVEAGSLDDQEGNPFTGNLSITEVPADLTPAALPENLRPDVVVTIQPGEMVFNTPAPLALPNRAGYAPGLEMDLWSINPNTGLFDNVGVGRVSDDGSVIETIEGGIRNSSWHFFTPVAVGLYDLEENPYNHNGEYLTQVNTYFEEVEQPGLHTATKHVKHDKCAEGEATQPINSDVELHSGAVQETHNLVTYQSLGKTRGLALSYNSLRADPKPIVHFGADNIRYEQASGNSDDIIDNLFVAKLSVKQGDFEYQVPGVAKGEYGLSGGENFWSIPGRNSNNEPFDINAALQVDMRSLPTGKYEYKLQSGIQLLTSEERFNGSSITTTDEIINVNSIDSPFGSGWNLSGLQEIVENDDGSVLLVDGDGSQFLFEAPTEPGGAYVSPSFDFSTLERINGTFRRTMKDQTVYEFDAQNKLELVRDRNGNETQYQYNADGQISKIIDPVGLETTFTYTNGRVSSITDPANRVTELKYDTKGNLIEITDPDESSRKWEYDDSHRMTAAIDKRDNRGEDFYDEAGRVESAVRPDKTVVKVNSAQTQGLKRPEQTLNPYNAPLAKELGDVDASYADGNGNVIRTKLDQEGQAVSSVDGAGFLPEVERNDNNLVTKSISATFGDVTEYTYDDKGNVLSIKDEISSPFQGTGNVARQSLFSNAIYKIEQYSNQIVAADFNGDGFLDSVIANYYSNNVSILLGNEDGTFGAATKFEIENSSSSIAVGDMNGDGFLDLVSLDHYYSNNVSIVLGNGDGTFSTTANFELENETDSLAIGDMNGDGFLDLVSVDYDNISISFGNGDGTFVTATNFELENGTDSLAVGDMNGDGFLDLVTTGYDYYSGNVSIILGNGDGTFGNITNFEIESFSNFLVLGDLDNDADLDIVVARGDGYGIEGNLSLLSNNGDLTFTQTADIAVEEAYDFALGDANGDGLPDIITANNDDYGDGSSVSILLNDGNASFETTDGSTEFEVGRSPEFITSGDINQDSAPDLLILNNPGTGILNLSVYLGRGDGVFSNPIDSAINFYTTSVVLGDVNGDVDLDLITANQLDDSVSVLLNNGDGTFVSTVDYTVGDRPLSVVVEDVNGDKNLDLITASKADDSVSVLLNNGDGTFATKVDYAAGDGSELVIVEDINGDANLDLITINDFDNSVSILLNSGDGTFATKVDYAVNSRARSVVVEDINGDNNPDLVTVNNSDDSVSVLLNNGDSTFEERIDYTVGKRPTSVVVEDINGDNNPDLVTVNEFDDSVSVLLNSGDGTFASTVGYTVGERPTSVIVEDLNGDNNPDLVTVNEFDDSVSVLLNNGDGTFDEANIRYFAVGQLPKSITLDDFDGDGDLDFATANNSDATVSVRFNSTVVSRGTGGTGENTERRYTYDSTFNQVTSVTDELGRITLYEIDPNNGNMLSTTRVVGEVGGDDDLVTSYTYTSDGQIDTMTDANGRLTDYDYNNLGRLTKTTFAKGSADEAVQQFEYNAAGNLTAFIDENNNRTEYEYDELNRLIKTTYAKATTEEAVETFEYDAAGNQIATVDANNNRTEYEYDEMNQLVKTIEADPDGGGLLASPITTYKYDKAGNLVSVVDPLKQETKYRYDARNRLFETTYADDSKERLRYDFDDNLIATIDANSNRTSMIYDARDRLTRTIDPLQNVTTYEYDAADQLIAVTDANQHETKYDYDDLGRQVAVTDARNGVTTTEYDFVGNVIAVTDANQNTTNFTYDNRDRQTIITDAEQQSTTTTYDDAGNVISVTDAENDTTTFSYDARNREIGITDPLNRTTTYTYDDANNLIAVEDALNRVTEYEYDALNRNTVVENALGDTVVTTYDAAGNVTSTTDELKRKTRYKYDKRNRLTTTIDPLNHQTTRKYDGNSNLIALTDALNQTTVYEYDALDRQKKITDAESQVTSFAYDKVGNLETVTDPEQNTTTYTYDELDRLQTEENELGKTRSYDYDAVGNLIATTDRNQRSRAYTYDRVDRQKEERWLDSQGNSIRTISYDYDKVGRLTNTDDPDSSYSYTYDSAGQLIKVDNAGTPGVNNVVLDYTYDAVGNLKTVTDTIDGTQSGIEEFTYDDLNRVTKITQSGNGVADKRVDMTYDAASQLKGINRYADLAGTQLVADSIYEYDVASRLKELNHFKGTDILAAYGFEYDAGNRITSFSSPDGTSTYDYDLTNQLTGTDHSYQNDESYRYDDNGNRTNDGYDTGTDNRLLTDGKYNYSYDDEGNRTQRVEIATGEITEYSWDYRNRLTEVIVKDTNGNVIKTSGYAYDMFDRRIAKEVDPDGDGVATVEVERFVYDGEHIALTFDGDGTQTHRYLHGPMIDQVLADENAQGEVLWALADNQGTVRDVVEADGTVVNHITYDSFGQVTGESNPNIDFRFGYTGREFDEETGQYYYRARYYDAGVGRFINQDPIGFGGGDINLYKYVANSPINGIDPTGNQQVVAPPPVPTPTPTPTGVPLPAWAKWLGPIGVILYNPFGGGLLNPEPVGDLTVEGARRRHKRKPKPTPTPTPTPFPENEPTTDVSPPPNPNCPPERKKKKTCNDFPYSEYAKCEILDTRSGGFYVYNSAESAYNALINTYKVATKKEGRITKLDNKYKDPAKVGPCANKLGASHWNVFDLNISKEDNRSIGSVTQCHCCYINPKTKSADIRTDDRNYAMFPKYGKR
jgi:RHS repeat-associated protein